MKKVSYPFFLSLTLFTLVSIATLPVNAAVNNLAINTCYVDVVVDTTSSDCDSIAFRVAPSCPSGSLAYQWSVNSLGLVSSDSTIKVPYESGKIWIDLVTTDTLTGQIWSYGKYKETGVRFYVLRSPSTCLNDGSAILSNQIGVLTGGWVGAKMHFMPPTYHWSNGATGVNGINGLSPGQYSVTVTDQIGCSKSDTFDIESSSITVSHNADTVICAGETALVQMTASGGATPYSYFWSNGDSTSSVNLHGGNYSVTVTDANGCTGNGTVNIIVDSIALTLPGDTSVRCNGDRMALPMAMLSAYTPLISAVATGPNSPTIVSSGTSINTGAGLNIVTVSNIHCSVTDSFYVSEPGELQLVVSTMADTILFSAMGGVGNYTFAINGNVVSGGLYVGQVGLNTVSVTDDNGCTTDTVIPIEYDVSSYEVFDEMVEMGPNPARDYVHLNFDSHNNRKVEIYNINGQRVISIAITDMVNTIDTSLLNNGVYFIRITNEKSRKTAVKKLIIQR